jgi:hypothetical protein
MICSVSSLSSILGISESCLILLILSEFDAEVTIYPAVIAPYVTPGLQEGNEWLAGDE